MSRKHLFFVALATGIVALLMWQIAHADAPVRVAPAEAQVRSIVPSLIDSEAEHASGAYIPGVGAVIIMDLLRGPNTVQDKASYAGTRDWAIYLMSTFGPRLSAVPATETISISIDFYDYKVNTVRQLVVKSLASDTADPAKYQIWLDDQPYSEATANDPAPGQPEQSTQAQQAQPTKVVTQSLAPTATTQAAKPTTQPQAAATTAPAATNNAGQGSAPSAEATPLPATMTWDFSDPNTSQAQWLSVSGKWDMTNGGYEQTSLGQYDLLSLISQPMAGDFRLETSAKWVEGDMGAGLVFNAPTASSKQGAYMISYTGKGTYLEWGYYDDAGVYQYQGGASVKNGADGNWHKLAVRVTGSTYNVSLDDSALGLNVPIKVQPGGYAGLLASTSHVIFDNVKLEQKSK